MTLIPAGRHLLAAIAVLLAIVAAPSAATAAPRLLVDASSGEVLYSEGADVSWHPASLTKMMTAHLALVAVEAGRASMDTTVTMSAHAASQPPSKLGLKVGETMRLEDALRVMMVRSTNDVAVAIAESLAGGSEATFVRAMNVEAVRLRMDATYFVNANGLHDPRQVTTARDMAVLAITILKTHRRHADLFATPAVTVGGRRMKNTNPLLGAFPGIDGMKTGYVCASGFNLVATAQRGRRHLVAVIFGAPSGKARGTMAASMLESGFSGAMKDSGSLGEFFRPFPVRALDLRKFSCGKGLAVAEGQ